MVTASLSQAHGQAGEAKGFPKHKHSLRAPPCSVRRKKKKNREREKERRRATQTGFIWPSLCLRACTTDSSTDRVMETLTTSPIVFSCDRRRIVMTIIVLLCYCSFCGSRSCVFVCVRATLSLLSLPPRQLRNFRCSIVTAIVQYASFRIRHIFFSLGE